MWSVRPVVGAGQRHGTPEACVADRSWAGILYTVAPARPGQAAAVGFLQPQPAPDAVRLLWELGIHFGSAR